MPGEINSCRYAAHPLERGEQFLSLAAPMTVVGRLILE